MVETDLAIGVPEFGPVFVDDLQKSLKPFAKDDKLLLERFGEDLTIGKGPRIMQLRGQVVSGGNPELPEIGNLVASFEKDDLIAALERIDPFMSRDQTRPVLSGASFELKNEQAKLAATDSYHLVIHELAIETSPSSFVDITTIFDLYDLQMLLKLMKKSNSSMVFLNEAAAGFVWQVFGEQWMAYLFVDPVAGNFPEFQRLMPDPEKMLMVTVDRERLLEAALIVTDYVKGDQPATPASISFPMDCEEGAISVEAGGGRFHDAFDATNDAGRDLGFSANPLYLTHALQASRSKTVKIHLSMDTVSDSGESLKPVLFGDDVLLMPMRNPQRN